MSAFGRRGGNGGAGGGRPSFGVARPMKGPGGGAVAPALTDGGDQFPPLDSIDFPSSEPDGFVPTAAERGADAMNRLADRQAASSEAPSSKNEGFEASIHRIKEQVLPRLLERVDPEAAATLSKDELAEEFRPIIGEVLAELKINLNRR
ncbi:MAG TPA: CpaF family protein, partial [Allosphingosinicella sp.]